VFASFTGRNYTSVNVTVQVWETLAAAPPDKSGFRFRVRKIVFCHTSLVGWLFETTIRAEVGGGL